MSFGKIKRTVKRRWGKIRESRRAVIIALIVGWINVILCCPVGPVPFAGILGEYLEPKVADIWFILRGKIPPPKEVVLISIDEKSHEVLGASMLEPWPRVLTARLLERLAEDKPKKVIIDYRYPERREPVSDQRLADAMKLSPTYIARVKNYATRTSLDGEEEDASHWLDSDPLFKNSVTDTFFAELIQRFGVVRTFFAGDETTDHTIPMAKTLYGDEAESKTIPTPRDMINFYGPPGSVISVPLYRVLDTENPIPAGSFKDKYVFVGQQLFLSYKATQTDTFMTPFHSYTAGVEIHATTAGNILTNNWIHRFSSHVEEIFQLLFAAILAYFILMLKPSRGGIVLGFCIFGWIVISHVAFRFGYFVPGLVPSLLVLPLFYAFTCVRYYLRTRQLELAMGLKKG